MNQFHFTTGLVAALLMATPAEASRQISNPTLNDEVVLLETQPSTPDPGPIEISADLLATESVAQGTVLATNNEAIDLLLCDNEQTNVEVVAYQWCAATELPDNALPTPGDLVNIWYLQLPGDERLATRVQRVPPEPPVADIAPQPEWASTAQLVEATTPPFDNEQDSGLTPAIQPEPQLESLPAPVGAAGHSTPEATGPAADPAEEDQFSFGKVIDITCEGITVKEYDFSKDDDVEACYRLQPETEYGNLSEEHPLRIGDDVVMDYREAAGLRFITTLVREDNQEDRFSFGKVLSLTSEEVTVREFDFTRDTDVETTYRYQPDTEFSNLSEAEPLQVGDGVVLVYLAGDGQRHLTTLVRENPASEVEAEAANDEDRFSFGKVVSVAGDVLTVREYDFAKDADVETAYQLQPETEYGNVSDECPLQIGDDVVLDYLERNGQRLVTTLVREETEPEPEVMESNDGVGTVIGINCEQITLLEQVYGEEMNVIYQIQPETRFDGFTEDRPVQLGELVLIEYTEVDGQRCLERIVRDEHPPFMETAGYRYAEVVRQSEDGILTVREFDVAADADVEVDYQLTGDTEFGSADDIRQSPGNSVILDYQIVENQRVVTTLIRQGSEEPVALPDDSQALPPAQP